MANTDEQIDQEVLSLISQDSDVLNVVFLGEILPQSIGEFQEMVGLGTDEKGMVDVKFVELLWDYADDNRASSTRITNRMHSYIARVWRAVGTDSVNSRAEAKRMIIAIMNRTNENYRILQKDGIRSDIINRLGPSASTSIEVATDQMTNIIYYTSDVTFNVEERIRYA